MNEHPPISSEELERRQRARIEEHLAPYLNIIRGSMSRASRLLQTASDRNVESYDDILRAVVVLNHAYLEDFLRTLALAFLPLANESALNKVPLAGLGKTGDAEKFYLGKLAQHRGKTIDDVLRLSVAEHLERRSFNSVTEIMLLLESVGIEFPGVDATELAKHEIPDARVLLSRLDEMMRRRHQIVHRADRAEKVKTGLHAINQKQVNSWLLATRDLMVLVTVRAFQKLHSDADFTKDFKEVEARFA